MRILITGVTGLIGREIGKRLSEKGHEIISVSRDPGRAHRDTPFPTRAFAWRSADEPFPSAALAGVEAVINLAGEPIAESRWTEDKKRAIRESRVTGTRRLVEAMNRMERPARVLVQGSAIGFYGDRGDETLTEASAGGKGFLADVVRDWEAEADALSGTGTRVVKVRTGIVFDRHGGALAKMSAIFNKGLGGRLASGRQWMSWIHIDDIVGAVVFALENDGLRGIINGVAPEPARNERFTVAFARALGRPVFLPVPEQALRVVLGEATGAVLASNRVIPQALLDAGFSFKFPELIGALKDLAGPIRQGQREFVAEQWVPLPPEKVFEFFNDEKNLEELTPPFLNFHVLGKSTEAIASGTTIDYRLSLHGVPLRWRSRITDWNEGKGFVDVQEKGPYRLWRHTHEFVPFAGGTLLRDRVHYRLPLGVIGDTLAGWKVDRDVADIFAFRKKVIAERFGASSQ